MIMKMRGDKCHRGRGKRGKIPLLLNNVGKKSVNDVGPQQGHNNKTNTIKIYLQKGVYRDLGATSKHWLRAKC